MRRALLAWTGWSMQRQMVVMLVVVTLLAWVGGVSLTSWTAKEEADKLHDREMKQVAMLLLGLAEHELREIGPDASMEARINNGREDTKEILGDDYRYQVWSPDGRLLLTNFGLPSAASMARMDVNGYSWLNMDEERWRVYTLKSDEGHYVIHVAERLALRQWSNAIVSQSFLAALVPSVILVLVLGIWMLQRLMRPLRDLADLLQQRSPANLDRLQLDREPAELQPVVGALNRLLGRVAEAIRREAGFTSLAAHEMRTPLATLKVLVDTARQTADAVERESALSDLTVTVDRVAHLQEQLLTLSRLEVVNPSSLGDCVELTEIVDEAVADLRLEAKRRRVKVVCHADGTAILGHRYAVLTLTRNVIGNALRYTPEGGRVEVTTCAGPDGASLRVDDSGPGIPEADRSRVFDRFERLGQGRGAGVGLGLSIVRTVATMHGASITLGESPLGGLRLNCVFTGRLVERQGPNLDSVSPEDSRA